MTVAAVLASLVPMDWPRPLRLTVKIILPIVAMALSMAILVFAFDIAGLLLDFHAAVHGFPFGNGSRKEF